MSKPLTYQIVARAREIIADPEHWAQGDYAVFKNGNPAEPHYQRAHRFCAVGALNRAAYELAGERSFGAASLANKAHQGVLTFARLRGMGLENINDAPKGHAAVLAVFDRFLKAR